MRRNIAKKTWEFPRPKKERAEMREIDRKLDANRRRTEADKHDQERKY
jgi:hypothetical protein